MIIQVFIAVLFGLVISGPIGRKPNEKSYNDINLIVVLRPVVNDNYKIIPEHNGYKVNTDDWFVSITTDMELPINASYHRVIRKYNVVIFISTSKDVFQTTPSFTTIDVVCKNSGNTTIHLTPHMKGENFNRILDSMNYYGDCFKEVRAVFKYQNTNTKVYGTTEFKWERYRYFS
ncbi:hypothetical protein Murmansk-006 [Murmansk poxvirus]|uniref:Poxvirus TNF receptor-II C-terminal domain-containing protein n=1 Tax=Murmansk poxvirus TaxID=2025359 RepID=A0A223FMD9_9POXV|nr:hypothetical protein CKM52_gp006 [Murmansk poxvirus]AST09201.1 hypothetical protein Murmansk-006 [Murmansk poxvirus]